jgi:hypothetical protein
LRVLANDQFGLHDVTPKNSKLVCAPAITTAVTITTSSSAPSSSSIVTLPPVRRRRLPIAAARTVARAACQGVLSSGGSRRSVQMARLVRRRARPRALAPASRFRVATPD